jgi:predicted amidophosphoribosyltransferase
MYCKKCKGKLEVLRRCRKVRMCCADCGKEYQIHEVADQLDRETEEKLERYTAIIYD